MNIALPTALEAKLTPSRAALHLAIGLFTAGEATLGQAAEAAGMSPGEFMRELGRRKIPFITASKSPPAEDLELLPKNRFLQLLESRRGRLETFVPKLEELWERMNTGGFSNALDHHVRRFNGNVLAEARALPLDDDQLELLIEAAGPGRLKQGGKPGVRSLHPRQHRELVRQPFRSYEHWNPRPEARCQSHSNQMAMSL